MSHIRAYGQWPWGNKNLLICEKRVIHIPTFHTDDLPEAIRHAKNRIDDAMKVVVKNDAPIANQVAAE